MILNATASLLLEDNPSQILLFLRHQLIACMLSIVQNLLPSTTKPSNGSSVGGVGWTWIGKMISTIIHVSICYLFYSHNTWNITEQFGVIPKIRVASFSALQKNRLSLSYIDTVMVADNVPLSWLPSGRNLFDVSLKNFKVAAGTAPFDWHDNNICAPSIMWLLSAFI